jgi:hypothetical protein
METAVPPPTIALLTIVTPSTALVTPNQPVHKSPQMDYTERIEGHIRVLSLEIVVLNTDIVVVRGRFVGLVIKVDLGIIMLLVRMVFIVLIVTLLGRFVWGVGLGIAARSLGIVALVLLIVGLVVRRLLGRVRRGWDCGWEVK